MLHKFELTPSVNNYKHKMLKYQFDDI